MIMQITPMFHVDGQEFPSMELAQAYIDNNADRVRLDAFIQHLKANGKERISKPVREAIEAFIEFEKGLEAGNSTDSSEESNEAVTSVEEQQSSQEADTPVGSVDDDVPPFKDESEVVRTGEEQEAKVEPTEAEVSGEVAGTVDSALGNIEQTEASTTKSLFAKRAK